MLHHKHNQLVAEYSVSKAKGPAMDQQKSPAFNGTRYTTKKNCAFDAFSEIISWTISGKQGLKEQG